MIHESDGSPIDFSWIYYIGHCKLLYSDHDIGRWTLCYFNKMYQHYKDTFDLEMQMQRNGLTYKEMQYKADHQGELIPS